MKNRLKEMLEKIGRTLHDIDDFARVQLPSGQWESTVTVTLPDEVVTGVGVAPRRRDADAAACAVVVDRLVALGVDWPRLRRDAQAGDALVKLVAYRAEDLGSVAGAARWLQRVESNVALAAVFDREYAKASPEVRIFGSGLGVVLKATVIEALIWRRYGERILGEDARAALAELRVALEEAG